MKKIIYLLILVCSIQIGYSQCSYTGSPLTQVDSDYTFCIGSTNPINTTSVRSGQFVVVNVVKGFSYTFSVGNVFTTNETLTILNATTNANVSPATFATGAFGATISNWTASLSGKIKILLSRGSCINDNTAGGSLSLTINSTTNTQDSQTAFGTDSWIGHVYRFSGGPPPGGASPSTPSTTTSPFLSSNYVGYFIEPTEAIDQGHGGATTCFPVMSNGANAVSLFTDMFAVRYRMRSTKTGCYFITIAGDDGVRVYIDGVLVVNEWKQQGTTFYCNNLIYLNGNSDIIFDFYEFNGGNRSIFSITPFVPSSNSIAGSSVRNLCSGNAPGVLDGSTYATCTTPTIKNVLFQWQVSTDNVTFTNIAGETNEDYSPPAITTTTNNFRYYRRELRSPASNAGSCLFYSNVITVITSPTAAMTIPGSISGVATQCPSLTNQVYSIAPVTNALTYTWTVPSGWTITSGQGTNTINVTTGSVFQNGNISVIASNACVASPSKTLAVTVISASVGGGVFGGNTPICISGSTGTMTLGGGFVGSVINWEKSLNGGAWSTIANTATTYSETPGVAGTWQYRALVGNGSCTPAYSTPFSVVVNPALTITLNANPEVCMATTLASLTYSATTGTPNGWDLTFDAAALAAGFSNQNGSLATAPNSIPINVPFSVAAGVYNASLVVKTFFPVCSSIAYPVTVTVSTPSIGGTVSSNQSICSGSQPASVSLSGNVGNVVKWQKSSDAAFTSPIDIASTSTTLSGALIGSLTATTYVRAVVKNGSCNLVNSNHVTVTVSAPTEGGTVSSSQTICSGSKPASVSLSGNVGDVVKWQKSSDAAFTSPIDIASTSTTLSGALIGSLTATTYVRAVVKNGSCNLVNSNHVTIDMGGTSTWNGTSWDINPDGATNLVFEGDYNYSGMIPGCVCTVNSGTIVINSGGNMVLFGSVNVNGGSLTFENNANLIQTTNAANTGPIKIKRNTNALKRLDYTIWSSPVAIQNLLSFSPLTVSNRFYTYNTDTNLYNTIASPAATNFTPAEGYLIRTPNNHPTWAYIWQGVFTGVPNNGDYSVSLDNIAAGKRFNMVGNPYPSPIDMQTFVDDNADDITGTLYFWRKTNSTITSPGYCTWTAGTFTSNGEAQVFNPNGVIRTGQGFFVEAKETGSSVHFNNGQRIANNGNQFFRSAQTIERNRMWINLTNDSGAFSQMSVGYIEGATQEVDQFDGKFFKDGTIAINSILNDTEYVIQGRALPFVESDVVPLSVKFPTDGQYTITLDQVDGLFAQGQVIYIKDNLFDTYNDITANPYIFTSNEGTFTDRFEIVYATPSSLDVPTFNAKQVVVYKNNNAVVINSGITEMATVKIFDIRGRLLVEKSNINNTQTSININAANEVLLVQITSTEGAVVTKKIIN